MNEYSTAQDKAKEWNLTARMVQIMCAKGKVEGAAKHAGVWFIPKNTQKPVDLRRKQIKD